MRRWILPLLCALIGIALGLAYAWVLNPVRFMDTTPASLRADFRADYVLMVAETYHAKPDANLAAQQLAIFGDVSPAALCAEALQVAQTAPYSQNDVGLLLELSRAMQALEPVPFPTLGPP